MTIENISTKIIESGNISQKDYDTLLDLFTKLFNSIQASRIRNRDAFDNALIINDSLSDYVMFLISKRTVPENPSTYCFNTIKNRINKEDKSFFNQEYLSFKSFIKKSIANLEKEGKIFSYNDNSISSVKSKGKNSCDYAEVEEIAYSFRIDKLIVRTRWDSETLNELKHFVLHIADNCNGTILFNDVFKAVATRLNIIIHDKITDYIDQEGENSLIEEKIPSNEFPNTNDVAESNEFIDEFICKLDEIGSATKYKEKKLFLIYYLYNYRNKNLAEIALELGLPIQTVHYRLNIFNKLRDEMFTNLLIKYEITNINEHFTNELDKRLFDRFRKEAD